MSADADVQTFLKAAGTYMDTNALDSRSMADFVTAYTQAPGNEREASFRRGLALSILGHLTPELYEGETGWDFDTDEEFRGHLREIWTAFYGIEDPRSAV